MGDAIFEEATFCWKMEGVVKNGRDCIRDVFDQGETNSCYAVAVTTTVNAASILKNGIPLLGSVQELNDCLHWLTYQEPLMLTPRGFPNRFEDAFCYTQHLGLFFESDYPFQGIVCECPECRVPKHKKRVYAEGFTPNAPKPTGDYKIHIHGFDEVKETGSRDSEFYQRVEQRLRIQPTTGAVCMTHTLAHWNLDKGEVYCGTPGEIGTPNHAVTVIGFGRKNDIDYYVCQNSYGTIYGCNGYLRIKRELVSRFYYPIEPYLVRYKDGQPDHVQQLDEVEEAIPMDIGKVRSAIANSTGNGDLEPARHID